MSVHFGGASDSERHTRASANLAIVAPVRYFDEPVTEAMLRARLEPWAEYDMSDDLRPLVVFDDDRSLDRILFRDAFTRRANPEPSGAGLRPLPPSVDTAVEKLRGEMDLTGRIIDEAHSGMAARWTDRGLIGVPAMMVWFAGIKHPYLVLTTEDLPPLMYIRDPVGRPIWHRHPGAYLHRDGRTLDVSFFGHQSGMDYTAHKVVETDTAVTFSVGGTLDPDVGGTEDAAAEQWTTITLDRPLANRFVISDRSEPLIVANAKPRDWAREHGYP